MIQEIGKAGFLIFLAELGDKTQILAMAFALQFSIRQVLLGVGLGSLLNHGLAVLVGAYLAHIFSLELIRFTSALLFLAFGLWSFWPSNGDETHREGSVRHPVLVVALAFFLGELGDKTQLTAIALASGSDFPAAILVGTVLGMVATSLAGILVGRTLGERIPELALKLISGTVFIVFGIIYLAQTVPPQFLTATNITLFLAALGLIILIILFPTLKTVIRGDRRASQLKKTAGTLRALERALQDLCLDDENCRGKRCPVGYCQNLIRQELALNDYVGNEARKKISVAVPFVRQDQIFDEDKVIRILNLLEQSELDPVLYSELKENLEKLLIPRQ